MKRLTSFFLCIFILSCMLPISSVAETYSARAIVADVWDGSYSMEWYTRENVSGMLSSTGKKQSELDESKYYVTTYKSGSQFVIRSAEELAGLAKLVNNEERSSSNTGTKGWFYNCKFLIELDRIDLGGYDWTPIGDAINHYFAGALIGAAPNNADGVVVIDNMTLNVGDDVSCAGLAGAIIGGGIKNITLQNTHIDAAGGNVGSFVGYLGSGYAENLSSDAYLTVGAINQSEKNYVGGIVGSSYCVTVTNCVFSGNIINGGSVSGGIVGNTQKGTTVSGCAVSAKKIRAEYNFDGEQNTGCGGIIGRSQDNNNALRIDGCYVNARLGGVRYTGGIIGLNSNCTDITVSNCQFDGIIAAEKLTQRLIINQVDSFVDIDDTDNGAFLGASLISAKIAISNCVNTGVAASYFKGSDAEFSLIGNVADDCTLNFSNNYSAIYIPFINGEELFALVLDGSESLDFYSSDNESGVWIRREEDYPILKNVYENESIRKSSADYSVFNSTVDVLTVAQTKGFTSILVACGDSAEGYLSKYDVNYNLTLVEAVCSDENVKMLLRDRMDNVDSDGEFIASVDDDGILAQKTTDFGDTYNVRIIAKIKGKDYSGAGFEYAMSYVDGNGVTHYSSVQKIENITQCYTSVIALDENGNPYTYYADEDTTDEDEYYFIGFVLTDLDKSVNYKLYVSAEVINEDKISGQAVTFDFDAVS